jgi:hypothetical protein
MATPQCCEQLYITPLSLFWAAEFVPFKMGWAEARRADGDEALVVYSDARRTADVSPQSSAVSSEHRATLAQAIHPPEAGGVLRGGRRVR